MRSEEAAIRVHGSTWGGIILLMVLFACGRQGFNPSETLCEGQDCSGHGECVVEDETARCVCESGYHDEGLACVPDTNPCDGVTCSDHGTCLVTGTGEALCSCDSGYHNDGPARCVPDGTPCTTDAECNDGDACTEDSCEAGGFCAYTFGTGPCEDGSWCTVGDTCDGAGACAPGTQRDCSGMDAECVQGVCNEAIDACEAQAVTDGSECGARSCAGLSWTMQTCQTGTCSGSDQVQACDDSNVCTDDSCDPVSGCANVPNTGPCDDLDPCTMNDTCGGGSCTGAPLDGDGDLHVSDACPGGDDCNDQDSNIHPGIFELPFGDPICADLIDNDCDGDTDEDDRGCQQCTLDADCGDNNVCNGIETCNAGACVQGTPLVCDDGTWCNGLETCDVLAGCQDGTPPCPGTECNTCQEATTSCFDPAGTPCTDNGSFCDGDETCDGTGGCVSSGDPCPPGDACNQCNETAGTCFSPSGTACPDGNFCTGTETCDGSGTCNSSGDPCPPGDACNQCNETGGTCFSPSGTDCDNGTYCDGDETCDGSGTCNSSGDPCPPGDACNQCNETDSTCFSPSGTDCDNGTYCDGGETCDGSGTCNSSGDPCPPGDACNQCNETAGTCFSPSGTDCDNGTYCDGDETCDGSGTCNSSGDPCPPGDACNQCNETAGTCLSPSGTDCDNGTYCDGDETCDGSGTCNSSGDPCPPGDACNQCNETAGTCFSPSGTGGCDDGDLCTHSDECDGAGGCAGTVETCNCHADQCNTAVCNPGTGDCDITPMALGTACAPDGGYQYMYCQSGECTHWCNNDFETPGDSDHECPAGYMCSLYVDTDSSGFCEANSGGSLETGENCSADSQCRSGDCDTALTPDRCAGGCSSIDDCVNTGPNTADWSCVVTQFGGGGNAIEHGWCNPAPGAGTTGVACAGDSECRDGYCPSDSPQICRDLCCTEADCPAAYVCWFVDARNDSYLKACTDMGPRGTDSFGTACSATGFHDPACDAGLCYNMGDGQERCSRYCCRDLDCPGGYICEFAMQAGTFKNVRACTLPYQHCCPNYPADQNEADDANNNAVYWVWGPLSIVAGPGSPEPTGATLAPGSVATIEGTSQDNGDDGATSEYLDVDTFVVNSGSTGNIHLVLDVAGTGADLDVMVTDSSLTFVEGPGMITDGSANNFDGIFEEDFRTDDGGLHTPGTDYYVTIGLFTGSTGLPVDWQLTICGE